MADVELMDILTYDYQKEQNIHDIADAWQSLCILTTPNRVAGVYEVKISITSNYNTITSSAKFRWKVDGGQWDIARTQPKDDTDTMYIDHIFPLTLAAGVHNIEIWGEKEDVHHTLNVSYVSAILERKA